MSRIGKVPVSIPAGVDVQIKDRVVVVKGPKGTLEQALPGAIAAEVADGTVVVTRPDETRESRALHGLTRTLIYNMVVGVTEGYSKALEIVGTGYRVIAKGNGLEFTVGYSHPVQVDAPEGVNFTVEAATKFTVHGIDKQLVGETAARIRKIRKPEPYKGKGIRYAGEHVRRKAGKAGK